jgi:hypothetical protein
MARKKQRISLDTVQQTVQGYLDSAVSYQTDTLMPRWDRASDLYNGDHVPGIPVPPRDDERSKFMSRDVHDTSSAMLPEVCSVFLSDDDNVIRYRPNRPQDVAMADLATQYVNFLFRKFGTRALIDAMHDAMVLGLGVVKVDVVEQVRVNEKTYAGLTPMEFEALTTPPPEEGEGIEGYTTGDKVEIEVIERTERPGQPGVDPMTGIPITGEPTIDAKVKLVTRRKTIGFVPMPPEERLIDPKARDLDTARFAAHVRTASIHELIGMGYDEKDFEDVSGTTFSFLKEGDEKRAGTTETDTVYDDDPNAREVIYAECYVLADFDRDGVRSRYKVCVAGDGAKVLAEPELVEDVPWAELSPWPVPHSATGRGVGDRVGDIQISNTVLFRALFDSLGQALFPARAYNENAISDERQLQNTGPGVDIAFSTSPQGQVVELTREFQGAAIMPVIALMTEIRENRTGVSKAAAGLNPDALQSTTRAAVAATVSKAEAQTMHVARNFAAGFERLGKLVLRAMVTAPASVDMMQLANGQWQEVDPTQFDPDMAVYADTARGRGDDGERAATLSQSIELQIQAVQQGAKITDPQKLYNAIFDRMRLDGFVDPNRYYTDPSTLPPEQPKPEKPDPLMIAAMAEAKKAEADALDATLSGVSKLLDTILSDDRERDKAQMEFITKMIEASSAEGSSIEQGEVARLTAQSSMITERSRDYMGFLGSALKLVQAVKQAEMQQQTTAAVKGAEIEQRGQQAQMQAQQPQGPMA